MCLSPHEMTTARLEQRIEELKDLLKKFAPGHPYRGVYEGRLEGYERILKERANAGTY